MNETLDLQAKSQKIIEIDPSKIIMSKTDLKGIIEYANDYFIEICGYSRAELMGKPHNIVRHPDMPKAVYKLLWDGIQSGKTVYAIVKNLAKNGQCYWVLAKVEPKFDADGNIISYFSHRKAVDIKATELIEKYYQELLEIETINKVEISEKYFKGLLEEKNLTYNQFLLSVLGYTQDDLDQYFEEVNVISENATKRTIKKPFPVDVEVKLDPNKTIMSKTDLKGVIQYSNDYFVEVSEYTREELMGSPHNVIRHPDMPKLVFKIMWDRLKRGEGLYAIVKNLTKSGKYYWVLARIEPKTDQNDKVDSYFSYRKAVPMKAVNKIEQYYKVLLSIEKEQKVEAAEYYFKGLLEEKNLTYDEFILRILETNEKTLNNYFSEVNSIKVHSEVSTSQKRNSKPIPVAQEILLDPTKIIMSKTNTKGVIEYANDYFIEISGYQEHDLMGEPHNVIRHPDMPRSIFKLLWDTIQKGENVHALVKNLAKDGRYYWVLTNFEFKYNEKNELISYYSRRKAAPREAISEIEKLYNTLSIIEQKQNMQVALNYFLGMLEDKKKTYNEFILELLGVSEHELKQYFSDAKPNSFHESDEQSTSKSFLSKMFK